MTVNKRFGQRFSQRPQRILCTKYQIVFGTCTHVTNLALFPTRYCVCVYYTHTQCTTHRCTRTGIHYCTYPNKKVEVIECWGFDGGYIHVCGTCTWHVNQTKFVFILYFVRFTCTFPWANWSPIYAPGEPKMTIKNDTVWPSSRWPWPPHLAGKLMVS